MKMKQKYMFAGMFLLLLMCVSIASAAVAMTVPVTRTNYTTITFTCTKDADDSPRNATLAYIIYNTTTETVLGTIVNDSADETSFASALISIEDLPDGLTYNFTCRVGNATDNISSAPITSVGIDNTAPVISVDRAGTAYIDYMTSVSISCSATDATSGVSSTTRTLTKPSDETVVVTDTPHTFTGGDLNELSKYTFTCLATDDASNSNSDTVTFTVQTDEDVIIDDVDDKGEIVTSNILLILLIMGVAAIVVIVVIFVLNREK